MLYCVIGVEFNSFNIPIKISILGSFTNQEEAINYREQQKQFTLVDIVETTINNINENVENSMEL